MRGKCFVLIVMFFASITASAADRLPQALSCGKEGPIGGLGAGTDLIRHVVDTTRYPEAICNDGTPAIFYYGASTKPEDRDKWIIFLQGGGSCVSGQTCAERWCSINTGYGMHKMSTSLSKPQIRGVGFMNPTPENRFGSWNRVLVYYCSSDTWNGTSVKTLEATAPDGSTVAYDIHFKGSKIVEAVIDTLRNAGASRRRSVRNDSAASDASSPWPDLDDATHVMFAGASAGGAGATYNLDRVAAKLHLSNPDVDVRGVIDAVYSTLAETSDFSKSTFCAQDPVRGCSYEPWLKAVRQEINHAVYGARADESCIRWHTDHAPGTEWRCSDLEHLILNHLTTPFFIRIDLQDTQVGGGWVESGFGTPSDFARKAESELRNLPTPEEPRGATPGLWVPQCTDHESFTTNEPVFDVKLGGLSWHDVMWNWWTNAQPQQVIRPFTGTPGAAPECP